MYIAFLTMKELEKRILDEEGKLRPNILLKDFVQYVGYRKSGKEEGLSFRAYWYFRRFGERITIEDLEKIREYGMKRLGIIGIGKTKTEELNRELLKYGVEPVPWTTKRYKGWELRKELQRKHGKEIEFVDDLLDSKLLLPLDNNLAQD